MNNRKQLTNKSNQLVRMITDYDNRFQLINNWHKLMNNKGSYHSAQKGKMTIWVFISVTASKLVTGINSLHRTIHCTLVPDIQYAR